MPREPPHAEVRNGVREGETKKSEGGKSSYEELIRHRKLNVKWEEVVGLGPCKEGGEEGNNLSYSETRPVSIRMRRRGILLLDETRLRENIAGSSRRYGK